MRPNWTYHLEPSINLESTTGDAPSVAGRTLAIEPLGATTKRPAHRLWRRFSRECCVKNTHIPAALNHLLTTIILPPIVFLSIKQNKRLTSGRRPRSHARPCAHYRFAVARCLPM